MKYRKVIGILLVTLVLPAMIVIPALVDQPGCQTVSWDFVHSHTVEFFPGDWSVGSHVYQMRITLPDSEVLELDPVYFEVTEDAPLYKGQVFLRLWGLTSLEDSIDDLKIHPDQDTVLQLSWTYPEDYDANERKAERDSLIVEFKWDGNEYVTISAGPIVSFCSVTNQGHYMRNWGNSWK